MGAKKQKKAAKAAAAAEEEDEEPAVAETPKKKAKRVAEADDAAEEAPKKKKTKTDAETDTAKGGDDNEAEAKQNDKDALTVMVRGLPFATTEDVLRKDFAECGEIEKMNMPMNEEGKPRGFAFIKYKTQEGFDAALKFDNTEYGGRTIFCGRAGEGKGKGKDGKGKDGKSKGADNENTAFVRGLPFSVEEEA